MYKHTVLFAFYILCWAFAAASAPPDRAYLVSLALPEDIVLKPDFPKEYADQARNILQAAAHGNTEEFDQAVAKWPDGLLLARDQAGRTVLHFAAMTENAAFLPHLIASYDVQALLGSEDDFSHTHCILPLLAAAQRYASIISP